jgi:subtilase family serine protease
VNPYSKALSLRSVAINRRLRRPLSSLILATVCALPVNQAANASGGQYIANNTPAFATGANKLGAADPNLAVDVSIWLKPHNRAALDALAQALYDPKSPEYRHWLKSADVAARFAPSAAEAQLVKDFFESNQLTISSIGPNNFYVRAHGTLAQVEKAFAVQIDNYTVSGQTLRSNSADPYVDGPAAALVEAVSGLDNGRVQHPGILQSSILPSSGRGSAPGQLATAAVASAATGFQSQCFPGPETVQQTTFGGYPKATYTGNRYNSDGAGCGYTPANIRAAYNLNALYAEGYDGTGQTIVLIETCGSPTVRSDANTFSERFGLPKLTASNFTIVNTTSSACAGYYPNINADVEWAHAIAPGAAIAMIVAPSDYFQDVDEARFYAVNYGLGNVICDDNTSSESQVGQAEAEVENLITEMAAIEGISANYAAGVSGGELRLGSGVVAPADSPYGTGIGGISLALGAGDSIAFQTAWETHASVLLAQGTIYDPPVTPPDTGGFIYGALGGPSAFFAKPSFQNGVAGTQRGVPDFSWLADPFTGGVIVVTTSAQEPPQVWSTYGGTTLATPMFSALWAIANQKAGIALGQAAPYLYSMPAAAVKDIVPYTSPNDVVATVQQTKSSSSRFNAAQTLAVDDPLSFGPFYSALWNEPSDEENTAWVLSFGQDFSFKATVGWDEATGVGAPLDAKAFVDWVGANSQ